VKDNQRKLNEPRTVKRPKPFYSAKRDPFGNPYKAVDNPRPDFRIREARDMDREGLFLTTRVFQPQNLNNNIVNLFNMDFGSTNNTPFNRFEGPVQPKEYMEVRDL
jgi:hypothetical protein